MRQCLNILKALVCDKRLRMLLALSHGELCESALAELVGIQPPTASRHLSVLLNAGLVDSERHGCHIYYRLAPGGPECLAA